MTETKFYLGLTNTEKKLYATEYKFYIDKLHCTEVESHHAAENKILNTKKLLKRKDILRK